MGARGRRPDRPGQRSPRPDHVRLRRHEQRRTEPDQDPRSRRDGGHQTATEGRFLGGRPPYGYRLADAGPAPEPGQGRRRQAAAPARTRPGTAPVVQRIFAEFIAGTGLFAIAEGSPPTGSRARRPTTRPATGTAAAIAWAKSAVRVILTNPRYTGRQVWNKQRKDEVLIDVDDVALGHMTKMRWNRPDKWIWSAEPATRSWSATTRLRQAQAVLGGRGRRSGQPPAASAPAGRTPTGACCSAAAATAACRATGTTTQAYYRCRFPAEYALANRVDHPQARLPARGRDHRAIDDWLAPDLRPAALRDDASPRSPTQSRDAATPQP